MPDQHGRTDSSSVQQPALIVWIIILNWNGLEDTLACLNSLQQLEVFGVQVKTIVIDNYSKVNPEPAIQKRFPQVKTIRLAQNLGFAAGCNIGLRLAQDAQADFVLLLNNDTVVKSNFLQPLIDHIQAYPQTGIVAPLIYYYHEPEKVWFSRGKITLALGSCRHQQTKNPLSQPRISDYVPGACMLIARSVWEQVGLLDEVFFAYYEDVDYCLRARGVGFKPTVIPESTIWHKVSASMQSLTFNGNTSPIKHYLTARNRLILVRKHGVWPARWFFILIINPLIVAFYLIGFLIRRRWRKIASLFQGVLDGLRYDPRSIEAYSRSSREERAVS